MMAAIYLGSTKLFVVTYEVKRITIAKAVKQFPAELFHWRKYILLRAPRHTPYSSDVWTAITLNLFPIMSIPIIEHLPVTQGQLRLKSLSDLWKGGWQEGEYEKWAAVTTECDLQKLGHTHQGWVLNFNSSWQKFLTLPHPQPWCDGVNLWPSLK